MPFPRRTGPLFSSLLFSYKWTNRDMQNNPPPFIKWTYNPLIWLNTFLLRDLLPTRHFAEHWEWRSGWAPSWPPRVPGPAEEVKRRGGLSRARYGEAKDQGKEEAFCFLVSWEQDSPGGEEFSITSSTSLFAARILVNPVPQAPAPPQGLEVSENVRPSPDSRIFSLPRSVWLWSWRLPSQRFGNSNSSNYGKCD